MTRTWSPVFCRPGGIELATGLSTSMVGGPDRVREEASRLSPKDRARTVLEDLVREGLKRPPLVVAFSGGRDSSALLALGAHLARREGLAQPVAYTFRYGTAEEAEDEADEAKWQELVIAHLGLGDWEVVQVGDRNDMVGELAQAFLTAHGTVYPPSIYNTTLVLRRASGGTHVSGEGGDEIFGMRRSTLLRRMVADPFYLASRAHLRYAALQLGPRLSRTVVWRRTLQRVMGDALAYLRPEVRHQVYTSTAEHLSSEPLSFRRSVSWHLRREQVVALQQGMAAFSKEHDVEHLDPFLEPRFVAAFAREVAPLGLATRSDVMKALFSDLLPDAILTRSSKALFNRGFLTDVGRAFAASWQGGGVSTDLVDPEALRAAWLSRWPPAQSFGLLQAAWLHENGPVRQSVRPVRAESGFDGRVVGGAAE